MGRRPRRSSGAGVPVPVRSRGDAGAAGPNILPPNGTGAARLCLGSGAVRGEASRASIAGWREKPGRPPSWSGSGGEGSAGELPVLAAGEGLLSPFPLRAAGRTRGAKEPRVSAHFFLELPP